MTQRWRFSESSSGTSGEVQQQQQIVVTCFILHGNNEDTALHHVSSLTVLSIVMRAAFFNTLTTILGYLCDICLEFVFFHVEMACLYTLMLVVFF